MINSNYSMAQCIMALNMLGKTKARLSTHGHWPDHIKRQYGESDFYLNDKGSLLFRSVSNGMAYWGGPIPIDDFWMAKISQSVSFECAKYVRSLSKKTGIKDIAHLMCRFYDFKYIPSSNKI